MENSLARDEAEEPVATTAFSYERAKGILPDLPVVQVMHALWSQRGEGLVKSIILVGIASYNGNQYLL